MIKREKFISSLDSHSVRGNWGLEAGEVRSGQAHEGRRYEISRIETLVAGFSSQSPLDCPFCYEKQYGEGRTSQEESDIDKLVRLICEHKERTGFPLESFRIGNTGEPLIHHEFTRLIKETQDCVGDYSMVTGLSVKDRRNVEFIAEHPMIKTVHVTCDAGDAATYDLIRKNGDFNRVCDHVKLLRRAGKSLKLHAIVLHENMLSLLELPRRMADWGLDALHVTYPLNTTRFLDRMGLGKLSLQEFRDFFLRIRDRSEDQGLVLTTDPWVYLPEMTGVIPDIDTPDLYEDYQKTPCDLLWQLIVQPDGTFHNCNVQNNSGAGLPLEKRPFHCCESLLDLANSDEALRFRELHLTGAFPLPCRKICRKVSFERDPQAAAFLFGMKNDTCHGEIPVSELVSRLEADEKPLSVRPYSGSMRRLFRAYPELKQRVGYIVDRDEGLDCDIPAVPPDARVLKKLHPVLLVDSNRSTVFQSVSDRTGWYDEIYKLVATGNNPGEFRVRRLNQDESS